MRYIIQNILKENHRPTIGKTIYLIMDKSGKYVFTKFLTRGTYWVTMENYGNGDGYQSYTDIIFKNRKEAQEFLDLVIYCFQHQDRICSYKLEKDDQRNSFNPNDWEVVEYIKGLMPKDDTEIFDNLTESEEGIGSKHDPHRGDFILAKKAIFVDGKDKATTMGNMYEIKKLRDEYGIKKVIFINDFDAEHTVTPTNHFFEEYFEYVPREYKEGLDNTDTLFEDWTIEPKPDEPKLTGIDLSDLTEEEKREVLKKLEDNFGVFNNFHNYAWVDSIEYLVTDFKTPYTLGDRENQIGLWFDSKEGFRRLTGGGYFVTVRMDGKKLIWREEISGREFLDTNFDLTHML